MKLTGPIKTAGVALLAFALVGPSRAADNDSALPTIAAVSVSGANLNIPVARPRMSPDLALQQYELRSARQTRELGETDDVTTITADLPSAAKHGQYQLKRVFSAPKTLAFKTIGFVGDGFVKSNVIARLLQSEADHVKNDRAADTAISQQNYKFSYKETAQVNGRTAHVFQVKPRHKQPGLFKGKVYIDAYSGAMLRAEGRVSKSPSLFIKKIEFVQDYAQVGEFNLVSHIHSIAYTHLVGKVIVDISHDDYQVKNLREVQASAAGEPNAFQAAFGDDSAGR